MIKKYRKKPIVVEALYVESLFSWIDEVRDFAGEEMVKVVMSKEQFGFCVIEIFLKTQSGDMRIEPGDYIIKGIHGEFYPCKKEIFEESYEGVKDEN